MKNLIMAGALSFAALFVSAQDSAQKVQPSMHFQSLLQAGLLAGKTESAFDVQSINGIKWKTFSAGIGIGIDNYVFRSVPVFLDIRKDILKKGNTPFVFADAGSQISWVQDNQKASPYYNPEYKSALYFNAGGGYKINLWKKNAVIFSAAFSLKKVDETEKIYYCDPGPCTEQPPSSVYKNKYTFKRLSLTAGWMIW